MRAEQGRGVLAAAAVAVVAVAAPSMAIGHCVARERAVAIARRAASARVERFASAIRVVMARGV